MFSWFKKKKVEEINNYNFKFQICYRLSNGSDRTTGIISVTIPAVNEDEATKKLHEFVKVKTRVVIKEVSKC